MYNITLIFTHHSENGKCNSDELYKIIELFNPEVIFDERPIDHNPDTLESKSLEKYKQNHNIEIIPVDIYIKPKLGGSYMFLEFLKHSEGYKEIFNERDSLIALEGFYYLNSGKFFELDEKQKITENQLIDNNAFYKDELRLTYNSFLEDIDTRENAMIQNICNYSKENQYNQAVFLIGAGHRKSIIPKIIEYEKTSEIKLNWSMYVPPLSTSNCV